MAITWKDGIATLLAAGTAALAIAKYNGWEAWLTAPRLGIVSLGIIGIAMCTQSSPADSSPRWMWPLSVLGVVALGLIITGLVTGASWAFYALAADMLALWLLSTTRHVFA